MRPNLDRLTFLPEDACFTWCDECGALTTVTGFNYFDMCWRYGRVCEECAAQMNSAPAATRDGGTGRDEQ
jgi:hypothetical protein